MGEYPPTEAVAAAQRDHAAEAWLIERHDYDWHIGNATTDEWKDAYRAVDAILAALATRAGNG